MNQRTENFHENEENELCPTKIGGIVLEISAGYTYAHAHTQKNFLKIENW